MRSSTLLTGALAGAASAQQGAGYVCPITPPQDATALEYGYAMQNFVYSFYKANGQYMPEMFTSFPNASMLGTNGMPLSSDLATNMNGLTQQAKLGVQGIMELAQNAGSGYQQPSCDYSYPPDFQTDASAKEFVMSAYFIEATMCGVFIGLADYVQTPQAAFLMARLAAEHGIHASFLGSYMKDTPYSADSMSLTPAFTPETALTAGSGIMDVGMVGQYVPSGGSCAPMPPAPCGGNVEVGMINSIYTMGDNSSMSAAAPSATGTSEPMNPEGNGSNQAYTSNGATYVPPYMSATQPPALGATSPSTPNGPPAYSPPANASNGGNGVQPYTGEASSKTVMSWMVGAAVMAFAAAMM